MDFAPVYADTTIKAEPPGDTGRAEPGWVPGQNFGAEDARAVWCH